MICKIVIFGTGALSKYLSSKIKDEVTIVAYLADNEAGNINGVPIISTSDISNVDYDFVVIAFGNSLLGVDLLKRAGVPEEKIVGYAYCGMSYADHYFQRKLTQELHSRIRDEMIPDLFNVPRKELFICGRNIDGDDNYIVKDYVRENTLSYLAKEIIDKNIRGNVLEVGVSEGEFARQINRLFKDRILYLFDTYDGLSEEDYKHAVNLGWGERQYALNEKITDEEKVLSQMPYKEKCVIKKGYFPDNYDIDDEIAFASIDIDFYETTLRGLEMIYPNLSRGGYIMVHDYNNIAFSECHDAVMEFCDSNHATYVPIPDISGTAIISK